MITLNAISLLNPVGSIPGQTILSTGPTGLPTWTTIPLLTSNNIWTGINSFTAPVTLAQGSTAPGLLGSATNAFTAAGTTQATATQITTDYVTITSATALQGAIAALAAAGKNCTISNKTLVTVYLYPAIGQSFDGLGINAPIAILPYGLVELFGISATQWNTSLNAIINCSMVQNFTQNGTGTVARTLNSKLYESISVTDFGADPTGVADSTAAIQAAINSLSITGGTINFPIGTFLISSPLLTYPWISLIGNNVGATIIIKTTSTVGTGSSISPNGYSAGALGPDTYAVDSIISIWHSASTYSYYGQIKNITLKKSSYSGATSYGIYAPRITHTTFEDLQIQNVAIGIITYNSWMTYLRRVTCQGVNIGFNWVNDGSGSGTGTSTIFENCWINFDNTVTQPSVGYNLFGLTYSSLLSCGCDNGKQASGTTPVQAFLFNTCAGISVIGCGTENLNGAAISVYSASVDVSSFRASAVTGIVGTNTSGIIWADTNSSLTLTNCAFYPATSASSTYYNWVIQGGANVLEMNPELSPSGGGSFTGYGSGATKTSIIAGITTVTTATGSFTAGTSINNTPIGNVTPSTVAATTISGNLITPALNAAICNLTFNTVGTLTLTQNSATTPMTWISIPTLNINNNLNNYSQIAIQNNSAGTSASSDFIAYANNVTTDGSGYVDLGINSSGFTQSTYSVTGANEGYLFMSAPTGSGTTGNLIIATDSTGTSNNLILATNGLASTANKRMVVFGTGRVAIGSMTDNGLNTLQVTGSILATTLTATSTGLYLQSGTGSITSPESGQSNFIGGTTPGTDPTLTLYGSTNANAGLGTLDTTALRFRTVGQVEYARFAPTTHALLLGTTTDSNLGLLQVAGGITDFTHSTSSYGGIGGLNSQCLLNISGSGGFAGTSQYGLLVTPISTTAGTNSIYGLNTYVTTAAATTVANVYGISVNNAILGSGGTISTLYGIMITDQTSGSTNYGLRSLVSAGTNKWSIYSSGTANSAFAGNTRFGSTATPVNTIDVAGTTGTYHIAGTSTAPTIAAGAGAGTSPTVSITGTDLGFRVTVTTGTLPTASAVVATVTFNTAYITAPFVVFSPSNASAALLSGVSMVYRNSTTGTFTLNAGTTGLTAATTYIWDCIAVQ